MDQLVSSYSGALPCISAERNGSTLPLLSALSTCTSPAFFTTGANASQLCTRVKRQADDGGCLSTPLSPLDTSETGLDATSESFQKSNTGIHEGVQKRKKKSSQRSVEKKSSRGDARYQKLVHTTPVDNSVPGSTCSPQPLRRNRLSPSASSDCVLMGDDIEAPVSYNMETATSIMASGSTFGCSITRQSDETAGLSIGRFGALESPESRQSGTYTLTAKCPKIRVDSILVGNAFPSSSGPSSCLSPPALRGSSKVAGTRSAVSSGEVLSISSAGRGRTGTRALPSPSTAASGSRNKHGRANTGSRSEESEDSTVVSDSLAAPTNARPRQNMRVSLAHRALIGKGSFGLVFQAMDRDTNRIIAVKEIPLMGTGGGASSVNTNESDTSRSPLLDTNSVFQKRVDNVRREIALLRQLKHPNIVTCLGEEYDDGYLRIYMEYVAGGSVSTLIKTFGVLHEHQASNFTQQILHGLVYLHSKNIIHRDLKGDNLLVDTSGVLKLADFGTAKEVEAATQTNAMAGTASFMPPEVIRGDGSPDAKSDIWSVGCCVVEMLSGAPPLSHLSNPYAIMMTIASAEGEVWDMYFPENHKWSAEAVLFLKRCLRRNKEERATAAELLSDPWITHPTRSDTHTSSISDDGLVRTTTVQRTEHEDMEDSASTVVSSGVANSSAQGPTRSAGRKKKKHQHSKSSKSKRHRQTGEVDDGPCAGALHGEAEQVASVKRSIAGSLTPKRCSPLELVRSLHSGEPSHGSTGKHGLLATQRSVDPDGTLREAVHGAALSPNQMDRPVYLSDDLSSSVQTSSFLPSLRGSQRSTSMRNQSLSHTQSESNSHVSRPRMSDGHCGTGSSGVGKERLLVDVQVPFAHDICEPVGVRYGECYRLGTLGLAAQGPLWGARDDERLPRSSQKASDGSSPLMPDRVSSKMDMVVTQPSVADASGCIAGSERAQKK